MFMVEQSQGHSGAVSEPKLLDQVRAKMRLLHYSIHTERSYIDWIRRYVAFHRMKSRDDLFPSEPKVESFLSDLAINGNVAPATQNQAMNALVCPTRSGKMPVLSPSIRSNFRLPGGQGSRDKGDGVSVWWADYCRLCEKRCVWVASLN